MRLVFFPKYSSKGPSSRYRIYNYLSYYKSTGFECVVYPLFGDWYLNSIWNGGGKLIKLVRIALAYCSRILRVLFLSRDNLVYIGADLLPYFPPFLESYLKWRDIKYIVDYDDAVFHNYDRIKSVYLHSILKRKHEFAIKNASFIITGSEYLTKYALNYNQNVCEIPTSIDGDKYQLSIENTSSAFIVGWIGSPKQSGQIVQLKKVFQLISENKNIFFHFIGFDSKLESELEGINYRIIPWSDESEVLEMSKFSVGIMPLQDTPFNRGKCAFKLVQYMAIGIPTISSPLRSNININKDSSNLFANDEKEWQEAILEIYNNPERYSNIGIVNKDIAFEYYTFQSNFSKYEHIIRGIIYANK